MSVRRLARDNALRGVGLRVLSGGVTDSTVAATRRTHALLPHGGAQLANLGMQERPSSSRLG